MSGRGWDKLEATPPAGHASHRGAALGHSSLNSIAVGSLGVVLSGR